MATVALPGIYAPADGTVRGIMAEAGDSAGQTVLSIAPMSKYTVTADISDAYDSAANKHVTVGETVYMECSRDGSHVAGGPRRQGGGARPTRWKSPAANCIWKKRCTSTATRITPPPRASASGTVSRTAELAISGTGARGGTVRVRGRAR